MIVILILAFLIIIYIYSRKLRNNKRKPISRKKKIENFNLGSSHSKHAFKAVKNEKFLNLANESQTLYYDFLLLQEYLKFIENGKICFLSLSYFSFASKEVWLESDLEKYFYILDKRNFKGKYRLYYYIYNYFPFLRKKFKLKKGNAKSEEERIKGHIKRLKNKEYLNLNLELLDKIIMECKNRNIDVILLTTPFKEKYNKNFLENDLEENFYKHIKVITQKYKIKYIDFSRDKSFGEEDFLVSDYDHLSEKGSKKFVEKLEKILGIKFLI